MATKKLSHKGFLQADRDSREAASAAALSYVNGSREGVIRVSKGKKFVYMDGKKQVRDKDQLERIRKLAIPPSWKDVWICKSANGHIQATGTDLRGRKQYRYHSKWNALRNETKFHKLYEFGKTLPKLRKKIRKDMSNKELSREKVLATAINLMDKTYIRIGSNEYEKMNGSYGLTTLKDKHVVIKNEKIAFSFTGKKGIDHSIELKDKKLARIIKECRDVPGKTLFQYYDEEGNQKAIDSGMVNSYIKDSTGMEFSAKDFRTWAGSLQAIEYCRAKPNFPEQDSKKAVADMLETVSEKLGNTKNVCKKYYVHPQLIALCEEKKMTPALLKSGKKEENTFSTGENILMCILKKYI
ncbi:MAG: DNA topoisomerase IB [Chitinophagaceae bacterium]